MVSSSLLFLETGGIENEDDYEHERINWHPTNHYPKTSVLSGFTLTMKDALGQYHSCINSACRSSARRR
jgi:hypothetical protein